jgi:hypothetical protein
MIEQSFSWLAVAVSLGAFPLMALVALVVRRFRRPSRRPPVAPMRPVVVSAQWRRTARKGGA